MTEPRSAPAVEPRSEPKTEPKPEPKTEPKTEPKPEPKGTPPVDGAPPSAPATKPPPTPPSAASTTVAAPQAVAPAAAPPAAASPAPPATPPAVPAAGPAGPPASDTNEGRLAALRAAIDAGLAADPPAPKELEALCSGWISKRLYELDPLLDARLKHCAAVAALQLGRNDVAGTRLDEASRAIGPAASGTADASRLKGEIFFARAELAAATVALATTCGAALGLPEIARFENARAAHEAERAIALFREVVALGDPKMTARALFRIAEIAESRYALAARATPVSFRGVALPSPFGISSVDEGAVLTRALGPATPWPREVARLYRAAQRAAQRAGDQGLVARIAAREELLAKSTVTTAGAPLRSPLPLPAGVIVYDGHAFRRVDDHGAVLLPREVALAAAESASRGPAGPARTYALVALAEAGRKIPVEETLALLAAPDLLSRVAALRIVELDPQEAHYEPVIAFFDVIKDPSPGAYDARFKTLERALFGVEERAIRALRAIVTRERNLAQKLTFENRLPLDERAYIVAELGDIRLQYRVQELAQLGDERATAIALYATYKTQGRRALGFVRQYNRGLPGCVAAAIVSIDDDQKLKLGLEPGAVPSGTP